MFAVFAYLEPVHRAAVLAEYYLAHTCYGLWSDAIHLAGESDSAQCSCFFFLSF
jgi:hypothetical protein